VLNVIRKLRLLGLMLLVSCTSASPTTAVLNSNASYRDPRIESLPRCAFNASEIPASKIALAPEREFAFRLPKDFIEVENPTGFVHGGTLWQRGQVTVSLRYGHWALESFGDETETCLAKVASFEAVVVRFRGESPSFVFWFLGSGPSGGHELIMGLNAATASDEPLLLSIGHSVFRTPVG
jgi:hypothetical protein